MTIEKLVEGSYGCEAVASKKIGPLYQCAKTLHEHVYGIPPEFEVVESDQGGLVSYLNKPLEFGAPKKYFRYAVPPQGDEYRAWDKQRYLLKKEEHKNGRFVELSSNHPERYVARVWAWLDRVCRISLTPEQIEKTSSKMTECVSKQEPLKFVICFSFQKFPLSDVGKDLRVSGLEPGLADLTLLHFFWSFDQKMKEEVYPPGLKVRFLNEANAFSGFPSPYKEGDFERYVKEVRGWITKLGWDKTISLDDLLRVCLKQPDYLERAQKRYQENLVEYADLGLEHPTVRAESRDIYLPGIGLEADTDFLLRLYGAGGVDPLPSVSVVGKMPTSEDMKTWEKILVQARKQAAYFRAFKETGEEYDSLFAEGEVQVSVVQAERRISIPTSARSAQEKLTHWNGGLTILPSGGCGINMPEGIAIAPLVRVIPEVRTIAYSPELDLAYFSAEKLPFGSFRAG